MAHKIRKRGSVFTEKNLSFLKENEDLQKMSFLAAVITENGALFFNDHSYSVRTQNTPRAFPKGELLRRAPSTLDELSV